MEIRTARLLLRPLVDSDAPAYAALLAHPEVHRWILDGPPSRPAPTAEEAADRAARVLEHGRRGTRATWAVLCEERFVGYVALHGLGGARVPLSYALDPERWHRGLGREAVG